MQNKLVAITEKGTTVTHPTGRMLASYQQLLVLQRKVNRPRGHKCLMESPRQRPAVKQVVAAA